MSLVDWQPSTLRQLKVVSTAERSALEPSEASRTASVVRNASIVAMSGRSIPAPLAIPPTVTPPVRRTLDFGTESVVMIAVAAWSDPSGDIRATRLGRAPSMRRRGSTVPIGPVEHISTSRGSQPSSSATRAVMASASANPASPVPALAQPEFTTTARATPESSRLRERRTGGAAVRDRVKTPVAVVVPSAAIRAMSRAPEALMPADVPAARNPFAAVTLTASTRPSAGRPLREDPSSGWRPALPGPQPP